MNLPTDNLYKFLAIAGLFVVGYSNYFFHKADVELSLNVYLEETKSSEYRIRSNGLSEHSENIRDLVENSIAVGNGTYTYNKDKLQLEYSNDEIKNLIRNLEESLIETKVLLSNTEKSLVRLKHLTAQLKLYGILRMIFTLIGVVLTYFGFKLWYDRVQKPQDEILQAEKMNTLNTSDDNSDEFNVENQQE